MNRARVRLLLIIFGNPGGDGKTTIAQAIDALAKQFGLSVQLTAQPVLRLIRRVVGIFSGTREAVRQRHHQVRPRRYRLAATATSEPKAAAAHHWAQKWAQFRAQKPRKILVQLLASAAKRRFSDT